MKVHQLAELKARLPRVRLRMEQSVKRVRLIFFFTALGERAVDVQGQGRDRFADHSDGGEHCAAHQGVLGVDRDPRHQHAL